MNEKLCSRRRLQRRRDTLKLSEDKMCTIQLFDPTRLLQILSTPSIACLTTIQRRCVPLEKAMIVGGLLLTQWNGY